MIASTFVSLVIGTTSIFYVSTVAAWIAADPMSVRRPTALFHAPAPKHDVAAGNPMENFTPEQMARVQAYMEHQQHVAKTGFPTDVRSLIQYNHGFAVMSTNSKL
jgi:hypothetical protein